MVATVAVMIMMIGLETSLYSLPKNDSYLSNKKHAFLMFCLKSYLCNRWNWKYSEELSDVASLISLL